MKIYNNEEWSQTTWEEIKKKDSNVMVLEPDQDFERPQTWNKLNIKGPLTSEGESIAPKWGKNQ